MTAGTYAQKDMKMKMGRKEVNRDDNGSDSMSVVDVRLINQIKIMEKLNPVAPEFTNLYKQGYFCSHLHNADRHHSSPASNKPRQKIYRVYPPV